METARRDYRERAVLWVVVALCCALPLIGLVSRNEAGKWTLNHCAMSTPDEHAYLLMAKSIAAGRGISTAGLTRMEAFYPPGLPLVLAAWGKGFGFSIESMHVCVTLTMSAGVAVLFVLLRRIFTLWRWERPGRPAALVTAVFASNFHVIDGSLFIFSEPLFMLVLFTWLYAALRIERWWARPSAAAVVTLLAAAATMVRAAGAVCFVATALYVLIGLIRERGGRPDAPPMVRMRPLVCVLTLIAAFYLGMQLVRPARTGAESGASLSYSRQLMRGVGFEFDPKTGELVDRFSQVNVWGPRVAGTVARQAWGHVEDFTASFAPYTDEEDDPFRADLYGNIARAFLFLGLLGWLARLFKRRPARTRFAEIFVTIYIVLYLVWPFRMVRFWIPILPLMLTYGVEAVRCDWRAIVPGRRTLKVYAALVAALAVLLLVLQFEELALRLPPRKARLNDVSERITASAATIRKASPEAVDTIVCLDDEDVFAMTWGLNPGERDSGYRVQAPAGRERIEALILRELNAVKADPEKRLFVFSYFKHDPRQPREPTLLLALRNLQREHPDVFAPSDPDRIGFTATGPAKPGQWKIAKLRQDWNVAAVWEISRVRGDGSQ